MTLSIKTVQLGPLETNCHIIMSAGQRWVVDPGACPESLIEFFDESGIAPAKILLTHGHGDHISGVSEMMLKYPDCTLLCPKEDAFMLNNPTANLSMMFGMNVTAPSPDTICNGGDVLDCLGSEMLVLDTSGHTPGGISFYLPSINVVITGDSLFAESIGRTDLPLADNERLIQNIRMNLLTLPDETLVLPGHGRQSTIGHEKTYNPFLR